MKTFIILLVVALVYYFLGIYSRYNIIRSLNKKIEELENELKINTGKKADILKADYLKQLAGMMKDGVLTEEEYSELSTK